MCGIAGIYFFKNFNNNFPHSEILNSLRHRGPDFQSFHIQNPFILYHARLSIIGLDNKSNQPLQYKNSILAFNGEIFNYQSYLKQFTDENLNSDTLLLARMLHYEGMECLNKLNGFFSISFYHAPSGDFFLIRDRLGVKPLYYSIDDEKICFASEIKPLLLLKGKCELNYDALLRYAQFGYVPGHDTAFKEILSLPQGHYLKISANHQTEIKPWFNFSPQTINETASTNTFFSLMKNSVELRLTADVPVGGFLSGGIDSAIVCGLAAQIKNDFQTFTLGFSDEPFFNEIHIAKKTSEFFKTNHQDVYITNNEIFDLIPEFIKKNDHPFADSSALNIYFLCKKLNGKIKVILSGDGADELFKGYLKHTALLFTSYPLFPFIFRCLRQLFFFNKGGRNSKISNLIRKIHKLGNLTSDEMKNIVHLMKFYSKDPAPFFLFKEKKSLIPHDFLKPIEPFSSSSASDFADLYYVLHNDMLVKTDRYSMQHGIEIRNPFLDYRVVEFALGLNSNEKINFFERKIFLKKTFRDFLPPHLFRQPKKGFEVPLTKWISILLNQEKFDMIFKKDKLESQGILNYDAIQGLFHEFKIKPDAENTFLLWAMWVLQEWIDANEVWIKK
ncbi:MAG: asparagine synthase (glutamine-hydrolyzing) [Bacteroidia bacterium]|nr:asparagine synthase (glutamine-hydrolyzing) [Bacteroidia bacterium]